MSNPMADMEKADMIFCIGTNMTECHPVAATRIKKAIKRGATMVVADPRRIPLAELADLYLPIRVGSDVALLLGMAHVIEREGLMDEAFMAERTTATEAYLEHVRKFPPEWAQEITGVPAADIERTALWYGRAERSAIYYTLGITEHICGVDNVQSLCNLALMTGNIGRGGHRDQPPARPEQHPGSRRQRGGTIQLSRFPAGLGSGSPGQVHPALRQEDRVRERDHQGPGPGALRRADPRHDHRRREHPDVGPQPQALRARPAQSRPFGGHRQLPHRDRAPGGRGAAGHGLGRDRRGVHQHRAPGAAPARRGEAPGRGAARLVDRLPDRPQAGLRRFRVRGGEGGIQ